MEIQFVSSRQNPLVKFVCGLADKKKRAEYGLFRFDGIKLLGEALSSDVKIKNVIFRQSEGEDVPSIIKGALATGRIDEENVVAVSESVFEKLSEEKSPEGIITVAYKQDYLHCLWGGEMPSRDSRILIAESLRDPGNLGTVLRSCYALGIDTLVISDDCADIYNPKTLRAAMGAAFKLPTVSVSYLPSYIKLLRDGGRRVFATALKENSEDIGTLCLKAGDCFVIGNEGHGLTDAAIDACTAPVIIPMREGAESLNASAAAAICIWETVRARREVYHER